MSKQDMIIPDLSQIKWEGEKNSESVEMVIRYSRSIATDAFNWYATEKRRKRNLVKCLRFLAILLLTLGGILPILTEIFAADGKPFFSPGWASVLMAAAGSLILFDRFFGLSSGWMRYTDAMMKIRVAMNLFDLEIADEKLSVQDFPDQILMKKVIGRCRMLVSEVNTIVLEETRRWDNEFRDVLGKLDEQVKMGEGTKIAEKQEK